MTEFINILFSDAFVKGLLLVSAFVAVALFTLNLIPDEIEAAARKRLGVSEDSGRPNQVAIFRWFRPLYVAVTPIIYASWIPARIVKYFENLRPKLQKDLITANVRDEITPDEFIGFRIVMSGVIFVLVLFLLGGLDIVLTWQTWPFVMLGGFFYPDLWLKARIKQRRKNILRALPYTLDLLTLSVEAGLDFIAAIQRLTQRSKPNALLIEFSHLLKEIRLGTSRSDGLRSMSDRLNIEEISSFTTLLIQADQLGASIGTVLRAQADQLRTRRFQAAETAGARASQLVLLPMVLFIFPAIFIIVLGPTILNFLRGGLF